MNRLWIITHPNHAELTVIASSLKDACKYAADYYDEPDGASEYDGSESHKRGRRWVGVDNLSDAVNRLAELRAVGVDSPLIRVTYRGSIAKDAAMLWEVGCLDVDWCWLDPGVLVRRRPVSRLVRHIDAQEPSRWYTLHGSMQYPHRRALCGRGAYVVLPPDGAPSGQWADKEHPADCRNCLRRLAKMDPDEAASTLDVRRELAALATIGGAR